MRHLLFLLFIFGTSACSGPKAGERGYADGEIGDSRPDIAIEVTPGEQQVVPNGRSRWEIVIRNEGSVRLTSVELTEFTRVPGFPVGPGIQRLTISDCAQAAGRTALDPGEERRFACESVPLDDDAFAPAVFPDPVQITFRARGLPPGGGRS
jgi:hypothetical protein